LDKLRLNVNEDTTGGFTVTVAILWLPLSVAVIVAVVTRDTGVVLIGTGAVVEPAGTVTELGTVTVLLVLERLTVVPPVPAGPPKVTVPVEPCPPTTVVGAVVNELTCNGCSVSVAVAVPFSVPVIVTGVCVVTTDVSTEKVPLVWFAGIETLELAIVTLGELLEI